MEVLERIKTDSLDEEERTLLDEWESDFIQLAEYREYLYGPFKEEMAQKHLRDLRQELQKEVRQEVERDLEEKVALAYKKGLDINLISDIFKLSLEKVLEIIEKHKLSHL